MNFVGDPNEVHGAFSDPGRYLSKTLAKNRHVFFLHQLHATFLNISAENTQIRVLSQTLLACLSCTLT